MLTAVITGGAGVAGLEALPDWGRVVIATGTAVIAGIVAVLQVRHQQGGGPPTGAGSGEIAGAPQPRSRPEQFRLPPDISNFINQEQTMRSVTSAIGRRRTAEGGPPVCVISGKGGVGKPILSQRYITLHYR